MSKNILLLAGTGAMGTHLAPLLASRGYTVDVISRDPEVMPDPRVNYLYTSISSDEQVLELLTAKHYNAIVDFLKYSIPEFETRHKIYLEHTDHYVFLSSYRIYNGLEVPDEFIVGYGLDYAEIYRNYPEISVLKPSVYED